MTFANKAARTALYTFAVIGVVATISFIAGVILDVQAFDRTSGGYEPPYTDYTGTPIDWTLADGTTTGMAQRGRVMNILIDCSTGMITFEVFKVRIPYRELSPRALAIHQPREACVERGFSPSF